MKTDTVFKQYPKLEMYHQTSDGTAFFNDSDAKNYAKTLKDKTVTPVMNTSLMDVVVEDDVDDTQDSKSTTPSVDEIKAQLPEVSDLSALELMLETEQKLKRPRKTAIEAIEARIAEVKEPKQD